MLRKDILVGTLVAVVTFGANAAQISSQGQLASILGGNLIFEDFEGNGLLGAGQIYDNTGTLSSTTTFGGYGPGLVQAGAVYSASELWWNDNGYFGLNTRTLADSSAWRGDAITISYTAPTTAMGFELQAYAGYGQTGTVSVFDTSNSLLASIGVTAGQFFGWESSAGIGYVTIAADDYLMIDNHGYGSTAPIPEPETYAMMLAGLGLLGVMARRRKQKLNA